MNLKKRDKLVKTVLSIKHTYYRTSLKSVIKMASADNREVNQEQQNPAFVIFDRSFLEPKHETSDGRFPPSYEQAMGLPEDSSSARVYSPPSNSIPPPYNTDLGDSAWVNPSESRWPEQFRRSIYSPMSDSEPEPYLNATVVTSR